MKITHDTFQALLYTAVITSGVLIVAQLATGPLLKSLEKLLTDKKRTNS